MISFLSVSAKLPGRQLAELIGLPLPTGLACLLFASATQDIRLRVPCDTHAEHAREMDCAPSQQRKWPNTTKITTAGSFSREG